MGLADDLAAHQPLAPGCAVGRILSTLDKTDRPVLEAAMADPLWPTGKLCELLRKNGHKCGDGTMKAHRAKDCACGTR